jgi:hypothetical protein
MSNLHVALDHWNSSDVATNPAFTGFISMKTLDPPKLGFIAN